jgi:flagellar hook protein FlgE
VTVSGGTLVVTGNTGSENALDIPASSIRSSNTAFATPFAFSETQAANGESIFTTFQAFDSLGTAVQVNMTMVLDSKGASGTTWRFYLESADDSDASGVLGPTGTISFDTNGRLSGVTNETLQLNRADSGASDPLQVQLQFDNVTGLTTNGSSLVMTSQDGFATGTLNSFSVGNDGVITGTFSNGLSRRLGQVVLANFTNPEGLIATAHNLYLVGPNSGQAIVGAPATNGAGKIIGGALELSNVDLTREFIGLISASTAFSANGRVISTSNDMLNELLRIAR